MKYIVLYLTVVSSVTRDLVESYAYGTSTFGDPDDVIRA